MPSPQTALLWVGSGVACIAYARTRLGALRRARALRQRFATARRAEAQAIRLLAEHGYDVVACQPTRAWHATVNHDRLHGVLRADYLVREVRSGAILVAEVKSGAMAPSLATIATRRQLLEYLITFEADGILLVDVALQRVARVRFPGVRRRTLPWWAIMMLTLTLSYLATRYWP